MSSPVNTDALRSTATRALHLEGLCDPAADGLHDSLAELDNLFAVGLDLMADPSTTVLASLSALVAAMPAIWPQNDGGEEHSKDFTWAAVRVVLSGAGYPAWPGLARGVLEHWPSAPFIAADTPEAWMTALTKAHTACGWPVSLAWADYHKVCAVLPQPDEASGVPRWVRVLAMLHLLKHTRVTDTGLRVTYRGHQVEAPMESVLMTPAMTLRRLHPTLGIAAPSAREPRLCDLAADGLLSRIPLSAFAVARPLSALPPRVFAGDWTRLVASPSAPGDFTGAGVRLVGAWHGEAGTVRDCRGDEDMALGYAWEIKPPTEQARENARNIERARPTQYQQTYPFNILASYAPQIVTAHLNADSPHLEVAVGLQAIYDTFMCLPVLRHGRGADLAYTHPFLWVLPITPTENGSTDNGASTVAAAVARVLMPRYPGASQTNDSDSAPDNRLLADHMRNYGGLWLDDWTVPTSPGHILARNKLQTLATGGGLEVGRVMENTGTAVTLREGIVANSKCVDLPPDLVNRSLFMYVTRLTDEQKNQPDIHQAMMSGRVSLELRMAAADLCDSMDLWSVVARGSPIRFPLFATMAARIAQARGAEDPTGAVEAAWAASAVFQARHYRAAEDSGLAQLIETRRRVTVKAMEAWHGVENSEARLLFCTPELQQPFTLSAFIRARCVALSLPTASLRGMLSNLGVAVDARVPARALTQALNDDLRRVLPREGSDARIAYGDGTGDYFIERTAGERGGHPLLVLKRGATAAGKGGTP